MGSTPRQENCLFMPPFVKYCWSIKIVLEGCPFYGFFVCESQLRSVAKISRHFYTKIHLDFEASASLVYQFKSKDSKLFLDFLKTYSNVS